MNFIFGKKADLQIYEKIMKKVFKKIMKSSFQILYKNTKNHGNDIS